jgi:hypothetical protein
MMTEQFRLLLSSGLYQVCDKLYIGIVDTLNKKPVNGIEWVNYFWKIDTDKKIEIVVFPKNNEQTDTLKWIINYSKANPDDYILHFHTKGITHFTEPTEDWRRYMEYFVIENWKDCIQKLNEGFDACGVMWNHLTVYGDYPHFSGGMWWAKCSYINTLKHEWLDSDWRYYREFWIGSNPDAKVFEFHNSRMNDIEAFNQAKSHYSVPYKIDIYKK